MPPIARPLALSSAVVLLAIAVPADAAQESPLERLSCGAYEMVPSGLAPDGRATRLAIQKDGRLLLSLTDWRITSGACEDLDADRAPELVVRTFSGAGGCCETVRVYALDDKPRLLLLYEGNNAIGLQVRDVDGDGRQELILGDDRFAHFGDLCDACSPSPLPLVACLAEGRVADCTARFSGLLRTERDRYMARLTGRPPDASFSQTAGNALGVLALSALLGEEDRGLEIVRAAVPDPKLDAWLAKALPQVREWIGARGKRLRDGQR
jgi:hypothetical protein